MNTEQLPGGALDSVESPQAVLPAGMLRLSVPGRCRAALAGFAGGCTGDQAASGTVAKARAVPRASAL
jgi:hypothetical protein